MEKGFSLFTMVVAIAILGLIYVAYDGLRDGGRGWAETTTAGLKAGASTACRLNVAEIERSLLTWSLSHPGQEPTLRALEEAGLQVPPCPEGGRLELRDRRVSCSLHGPGPD